jgi:enhancing lycopene biosynthesis protein 2
MVAVILSGCGVYDGSEIQEAVLTLLELENNGFSYMCYAPDIPQYHVVNHRSGQPTEETRNVLDEAARIARGNIADLSTLDVSTIEAMVLVGGFGVAKNLSTWALHGSSSSVLPAVQAAVVEMLRQHKPIVALCISPTVIAKAVQDIGVSPRLTIGTTDFSSEYAIAEIQEEVLKTGAQIVQASIEEIEVDTQHKVISAPCYMMQATISEVHRNIAKAISAIRPLL